MEDWNTMMEGRPTIPTAKHTWVIEWLTTRGMYFIPPPEASINMDVPEEVKEFLIVHRQYLVDLEEWNKKQPLSYDPITQGLRMFDGPVVPGNLLLQTLEAPIHEDEDGVKTYYSTPIVSTYEDLIVELSHEELRPIAAAIYKWFLMRQKIDTELTLLLKAKTDEQRSKAYAGNQTPSES